MGTDNVKEKVTSTFSLFLPLTQQRNGFVKIRSDPLRLIKNIILLRSLFERFFMRNTPLVRQNLITSE